VNYSPNEFKRFNISSPNSSVLKTGRKVSHTPVATSIAPFFQSAPDQYIFLIFAEEKSFFREPFK